MDLVPLEIALPRIALVEDDENLALVLRYNLEAIGFSVDWIIRGDVALRDLLARPPALVILDWMLPGLAGIEILRHLRGQPRSRHIPVLMLTGCASPEERKRALAYGADMFVAKPFAVRDLLSNLQRLRAEASKSKPAADSEVVQ